MIDDLKDVTAVAGLVEKIAGLEPPDQLRLAAELLEARQPAVALAIIRKIGNELEILRMHGLF